MPSSLQLQLDEAYDSTGLSLKIYPTGQLLDHLAILMTHTRSTSTLAIVRNSPVSAEHEGASAISFLCVLRRFLGGSDSCSDRNAGIEVFVLKPDPPSRYVRSSSGG